MKNVIEINNEDGLYVKAYFYNGVPHRTDGPALTIRMPGCSIDDSTKKSLEGLVKLIPFDILISPNVNLNYVGWFSNGVLHRLGRPAFFYKLDDFMSIRYYQNGLLHREDGPALVSNLMGGSKEWYCYGKRKKVDLGFISKHKDKMIMRKKKIKTFFQTNKEYLESWIQWLGCTVG